MNDAQFDDFKQLLEATVSQSETRLTQLIETTFYQSELKLTRLVETKVAQSEGRLRQEMNHGFGSLRQEMTSGFAAVGDSFIELSNLIDQQYTGTNRRLTRLEQPAP